MSATNGSNGSSTLVFNTITGTGTGTRSSTRSTTRTSTTNRNSFTAPAFPTNSSSTGKGFSLTTIAAILIPIVIVLAVVSILYRRWRRSQATPMVMVNNSQLARPPAKYQTWNESQAQQSHPPRQDGFGTFQQHFVDTGPGNAPTALQSPPNSGAPYLENPSIGNTVSPVVSWGQSAPYQQTHYNAPAHPPQNQYTPPPQSQHSPPIQNQYTPLPQNQYTPPPQNQYTPPPQNQHTPPPQSQYTPPPQNQYPPQSPYTPPSQNPQPMRAPSNPGARAPVPSDISYDQFIQEIERMESEPSRNPYTSGTQNQPGGRQSRHDGTTQAESSGTQSHHNGTTRAQLSGEDWRKEAQSHNLGRNHSVVNSGDGQSSHGAFQAQQPSSSSQPSASKIYQQSQPVFAATAEQDRSAPTYSQDVPHRKGDVVLEWAPTPETIPTSSAQAGPSTSQAQTPPASDPPELQVLRERVQRLEAVLVDRDPDADEPERPPPAYDSLPTMPIPVPESNAGQSDSGGRAGGHP